MSGDLPDKRHGTMDGYIVGAGGANFDIHIRTTDAPVLRDSNPGHLRTSAGGVCRNIMENLARQGDDCVLLSAVGEDALGDRIRSYSEKAGVDVSRLFLHADCPTSCYMAFLDESGDMLVAANDMRIMDLIPDSYLLKNADVLRDADAVLCDANPPAERIAQLAELAGDTPIFADPVSVAKGGRFLPVLDKLYLLKPNRIELQHLSGLPCNTDGEISAASKALLDKGLQSIAVSLGSRGCYYADRAGRSFFRMLKPIADMANATGAGDAFMAGLACAFVRGASPEDMVDYALACGLLAVQSEDTINPQLSDETVRKTLQEQHI